MTNTEQFRQLTDQIRERLQCPRTDMPLLLGMGDSTYDELRSGVRRQPQPYHIASAKAFAELSYTALRKLYREQVLQGLH